MPSHLTPHRSDLDPTRHYYPSNIKVVQRFGKEASLTCFYKPKLTNSWLMDEAISLQGCDNKLTLTHFSDPESLLVVNLDYHPAAKSHLPSHFSKRDHLHTDLMLLIHITPSSHMDPPHYTSFPCGSYALSCHLALAGPTKILKFLHLHIILVLQ